MAMLIIIGIIAYLIPKLIQEQKEQKELSEIFTPNSIYADDFIYKKNNLYKNGLNTKGVYVFTNLSKENKRYVGQSINIVNRVQEHLKGRGSKELHYDLKRGDEFIIEFVRLSETESPDLNTLESYLIAKYNSYYKGYNKTRGNS